jgi:aspartate/methionine/tyrosine aminotransferase
MATPAELTLPAALNRLGTEGAFAVLSRARELEAQGRSVVHLEIGEPDFDTPAAVKEVAVRALADGETGYGPPAGMPVLREAAAAHLSETRGIDVAPGSVLIAPGAKPFLLFTVLATCEPGDQVVIPDPGFPIYASAVRWAGAVPVGVPLKADDGFALDLDALRAALGPRTRLVILNAPHNPTGGTLSPDAVAEIARMLAGTRAWVLSDEVYRSFLFGGEFASVAAEPGMLERTILVDSFSKTYAMTGWRCGFAAVPEPLIDPLTRFFVNCFSCVPGFVQLAAAAALTGSQAFVEEMIEEFRARRELVVDGLDALPGVSCRPPGGAFYAFPNIAGTGRSETELASELLEQAGVALLAGTSFGAGGAGHLRVSFAAPREVLREALDRIAAHLG